VAHELPAQEMPPASLQHEKVRDSDHAVFVVSGDSLRLAALPMLRKDPFGARAMNDWPKDRHWLETHDYEFQWRGICRGENCRREIEWWRTPAGRNIPLEQVRIKPGLVAPNTLEPHWSRCPNEKEFRHKPAEEKPPKEAVPEKPKIQKPKVERIPQTGRLF